MRHILRCILVASFLGLVTSANAQECSTANQPPKTWNQQPSDPLCGSGPGQTYFGNPTFTVYSTTVDTCTNNNTGAVYAQGVRQVTGNGAWHCHGISITGDFKCNPRIEQEATHATSSTDYNRFYLRAWDINPGYDLQCTEFPGLARQDFWQCIGIACSCPGPHTCPANYLWNYNTCSCVKVSPIVLDINGKGFSLTDAQHGVLFDPGIGRQVQKAWTAQGTGNAFLALPGPDGVVHSGKELFGNLTPQPASNDPNGFAALAVYDDPKNGGNGDGVIDTKDAIFSSLRLWIDANHDGISQKNELHNLPSLGVNSLSLKYKETPRTDQYGNEFRFKGRVNPDDPHGSQVDRVAYDVFFVSVAENPTANAKCAVPTVVPGIEKRDGLLSRR